MGISLQVLFLILCPVAGNGPLILAATAMPARTLHCSTAIDLGSHDMSLCQLAQSADLYHARALEERVIDEQK